MADRQVVRRWTRLAIAAAALAVASPPSLSFAGQIGTACCLPAGGCQDVAPNTCQAQLGGTPQLGTTCATANCPIPCSAAGPECNGVCPAGETCVLPGNGAQVGATTNALALCFCVPEIPEGGACAQQPDACAPGLSCQNGICAVVVAPAPALSTMGLAIALASLVALAFVRRRRHG